MCIRDRCKRGGPRKRFLDNIEEDLRTVQVKEILRRLEECPEGGYDSPRAVMMMMMMYAYMCLCKFLVSLIQCNCLQFTIRDSSAKNVVPTI